MNQLVLNVVKAAHVVVESPDFPGLQDLAKALHELEQAGAIETVCMAKYSGEPTFNLVGRDQLAPSAIETWIIEAKKANLVTQRVPDDKIEDATEKLKLFLRWQVSNQDKVKYPD